MHGGDVAHVDVAGGADGGGNGGEGAGEQAPDGLESFVEVGGEGGRLDWGASDDGGVDGGYCERGLLAVSWYEYGEVRGYRPCARL